MLLLPKEFGSYSLGLNHIMEMDKSSNMIINTSAWYKRFKKNWLQRNSLWHQGTRYRLCNGRYSYRWNLSKIKTARVMCLWSVALKLINFLPINWNLAPAEFQHARKFIMVSQHDFHYIAVKSSAIFDSPVSQWLSPNGEQPEQRKLAHTL